MEHIVFVHDLFRVSTYKLKFSDSLSPWISNLGIERHFINSADYLILESRARSVLDAKLPIEKIIGESKDISKQFAGMTVTPLTPERVLGLIFALAAQAEAASVGVLIQVNNGH